MEKTKDQLGYDLGVSEANSFIEKTIYSDILTFYKWHGDDFVRGYIYAVADKIGNLNPSDFIERVKEDYKNQK